MHEPLWRVPLPRNVKHFFFFFVFFFVLLTVECQHRGIHCS